MGRWRSKHALLVLVVWLWMFVGSITTIVLITCIKDVSLDPKQIIDMLNREPSTITTTCNSYTSNNVSMMLVCSDLSFRRFNLEFPYNIWYVVLGILSYGPLEVFFVIWLIVNIDDIFNSREKIYSPGLLITVWFLDYRTYFFHLRGLLNVIKVTVVSIVLGLVFKYTKNSIGSMIAWSLINGQVLYLLVGCLT